MIGHIEEGRRIDKAVCGSAQTFAIRGVELVDARGVIPHSWVSVVDGAIDASGTFDDDLATHIEMMGGADHIRVIDGQGHGWRPVMWIFTPMALGNVPSMMGPTPSLWRVPGI